MAADEPDERLKLILDEALRSLNHQQGILDGIRSRTTMVVAAAALVTSFVGGPVIKSDNAVGWSGRLGFIFLIVVLGLAMSIAFPWQNWAFRSSPSTLLRLVDGGWGLDDLRRRYAQQIEEWIDENEKRLASMNNFFRLAFVALIVETAAFSYQLLIWQQ